MVSKEERINEAMRERISQLEEELKLCKHHLSETIRNKEVLECDIDALQKEAHVVVAQWATKANELSSELDKSVSEVEKLRDELKHSEKVNDDLRQRLKDAEAVDSLHEEELHILKMANENLTEKVSAAERDFCSASQRIIQYEDLVSKMDLEMKQSIEDIKTLTKEKSRLIEVNAELREEKGKLELLYYEARDLSKRLEEELMSSQKSLYRCNSLIVFFEEESCSRNRIVFEWQSFFLEYISSQGEKNKICLLELEKKAEDLQQNNILLQEEKDSLETQLREASAEFSSSQIEYNTTIQELRDQVRLLENDVAELQDSQVNQNRILETIQEEFDKSVARCRVLESTKEELETEFRAVKECYSSLLLEYNDVRVNEQKRLHELNAKISLLTDEKTIIRNDYETRLQEVLTENALLCENMASTRHDIIFHLEYEERLMLEVMFYEEWLSLVLDRNSKVLSWSSGIHAQLLAAMKDINLLEESMNKRQTENDELREELENTKKEFASEKSHLTLLESKVEQLTSELNTSRKKYEEVLNDNNWLKEQVESMRIELGELDGLLNSSLNEMREESEKQKLEQERLISEIRRYEDLLQRSQERIDSLDERCRILASENEAMTKTLILTEGELQDLKEENKKKLQRDRMLTEQNKKLESTLLQMQKEYANSDNQSTILKEQLKTQETKIHIISTSARQEIEAMKIKLNSFIEKCEKADQRVANLSESLQESENNLGNLREAYQRARVALEEAKQRCCKDAETIQKLLENRESLMQERDTVVQKYNRIHDILKGVKKENSGRVTDEIHRLSNLCSQQEVELQQLRHQNVVLKRGIIKLPENTGEQLERPVFVERLNLMEGPIRRPKKRLVLGSDTKANE
ncbi:BRCT domain-containing protein [Trypanosoma theileri]|uniref:BRCT domain-containing protein n=1 Tax=Trypanosoma theileri TaxID=67003 RepID=A0A1X0NIX3_9TRYP|nr:BRCT domain-containing protein [Trypanosoma theileri]ORC84714.1 BRCT domain-containing protein [Trypanosoma theileri]